MYVVGVKFGYLTVVSGPYASKRGKYAIWECKCGVCGSVTKIPRDSLETMTHCGCKHHAFLHGGSGTATHQAWMKMISKCTNPKDPKYKDFGGKGVKVSLSWKSFLCFLKDMGEKPEGMNLGRKNNKGNFTAYNCEWVKPKEQTRNRQSCLMYVIDGEKMALSAVAEKYGVNYQALYRSVRTRGTDLDVALRSFGVII